MDGGLSVCVCVLEGGGGSHSAHPFLLVPLDCEELVSGPARPRPLVQVHLRLPALRQRPHVLAPRQRSFRRHHCQLPSDRCLLCWLVRPGRVEEPEELTAPAATSGERVHQRRCGGLQPIEPDVLVVPEPEPARL